MSPGDNFTWNEVAVLTSFVVVFALSFASFWIIKRTIGLRVDEREEESGLDISSHGMYGYPEAFIPQPEYPVGDHVPHVAGTPVALVADPPPAKASNITGKAA
jgi:Amt family ammonium transporter